MKDDQFQALLDALRKPGAAEKVAKALSDDTIQVKEPKEPTKIQIEVPHHYHCQFCGTVEIKVYMVDMVSVKKQEPIHQNVNWCSNCVRVLKDKDQVEIVNRAIALIKKLGYKTSYQGKKGR